MVEYQDMTVTCCDPTCETEGKQFVITAGEQTFFASKGFPVPKRCKDCRIKKKQRQEQEVDQKKTREASPFTPILNDMRQGKYGNEHKEDRGRREKKPWKKNRRHGREPMGDFEGQG
jgi:hypothetical protein